MNYVIHPQAINFLNGFFKDYHYQFAIRLYLEQPGTATAQLKLEMEPLDLLQSQETLESLPVGEGWLFFEKMQKNFLENLTLGYKATLTGGELEVDLPALYGEQTDLPLIARIERFFQREIQPALQAHKGQAEVKFLNEDNDLIIAFTGGCQGCSMASVTLKNIIEQKVREHFPQVRNIIDQTKHHEGKSPYA